MDNKGADVKVFYSYSHKDESLRDALQTHLSILSRNGVISEWHDRRIKAGQEWEKEIDEEIENADIILLLISPDFIASDYCYGKELTRAIEKHESKQARVIPIIIRPTEWSHSPFAKLQALPKDAKAVTSWSNEDEAWLDVAKGIGEASTEATKLKNRRGETAGFQSIRELLTVEVDEIDRAFQKDGETTFRGVSTGLVDLDQITDGLHSSEFIVVASRPGMGKEDLVLNIAAHASIKERLPVAYFSLTAPADRVARRLMSGLGRVSSYALLRGSLDDEDWPRLTSAVSILADVPLYIDDSLSLTWDAIRDRLVALRKKHDIKLLVIDSLQHVIFPLKQGVRRDSDERLSKEIKTLARELRIPVVATTSVNPLVERRPNKRPILVDLDLKGVEDDADTVVFVYRDEMYERNTLERGVAELIVAKNSNGPIGCVRAVYLDEYARFENVVYDSANE